MQGKLTLSLFNEFLCVFQTTSFRISRFSLYRMVACQPKFTRTPWKISCWKLRNKVGDLPQIDRNMLGKNLKKVYFLQYFSWAVQVPAWHHSVSRWNCSKRSWMEFRKRGQFWIKWPWSADKRAVQLLSLQRMNSLTLLWVAPISKK